MQDARRSRISITLVPLTSDSVPHAGDFACDFIFREGEKTRI